MERESIFLDGTADGLMIALGCKAISCSAPTGQTLAQQQGPLLLAAAAAAAAEERGERERECGTETEAEEEEERKRGRETRSPSSGPLSRC